MAITDLTNTTWEIPAGWTATAGYGQFSFPNPEFAEPIKVTINGTTTNYLGIHIGYTQGEEGRATTLANSIAFENGNGFTVTSITNSVGFTITFEENAYADYTNTSLISWLEENGALQGGEEETTDLYPIYKGVNGKWVKLTAFKGINGAWVKISSAVETEEPEQPQDPENCLTFSSPSSFTLGVVDNLKYWDGTLEYSTDGSTWTTWAGTSAISSASDGTKHNLYMRGTGNTYITGSSAGANKARWSLTGSNISCNGNIETLLDYATVANGEHPPMATHCYYYLFYTCSNLVTAPALPATTLSYYCYGRMFRSCTSLTTAPKLPATTLADYCYYQMFRYCTSLVTLPELPATTLTTHCYEGMFQSCSQIKLSTTQTGEYQTAYRIPSNGTGTSADYWNTNMFVSTGGTYVGSLSINTTYYTSNTVV